MRKKSELPIYEKIITSDSAFPADVFIQDNLKEAVDVEEHFHDCFELLFFLKGEANQKLNKNIFTAKEGDLVLIRSGDIHATTCDPGLDCRILVLKFLPSMLDSRLIRLEGMKYLGSFLNHSTASDINKLSENKRSELREILFKVLDEYSSKEKAFELRIKGYIFEIAALLTRYELVNISKEVIDPADAIRMSSVLKSIEENCHMPLTLKTVAEELNMNYSYVSRYFKKVTGKNFKEYLDYIRVCEAEHKILKKEKYIYEIAQECGFVSVQSFNRVYRRIRGFSPREIFNK